MNFRFFKLLFLFIFLSPVQDQPLAECQDSDNQDQRGELCSGSFAATQETNQFGRIMRLPGQSQKGKKTSRLSFHSLAAAGTDSAIGDFRNQGRFIESPQSESALVSESLLRHCYRSKSSDKVPDPRV